MEELYMLIGRLYAENNQLRVIIQQLQQALAQHEEVPQPVKK
jgi:hypothetical protein